jgi:two-component system OmpR family sensor kinase
MGIRWRLTLWFSLILLVILGFSGSVFYFLLQHYLFQNVDNSLLTYTSRVHGNLQNGITPGSDFSMIHSNLPAVNEFASPGIYIQLIDSNGAVVVKSDNLSSQELPVSPSLVQKALAGGSEIRSVAAGNAVDVRIMVSPLHMPDRTLVLEVAQSLKPVEDALGQFRLALAVETLVALFMTAILGAILVRRTLKPVENITRTARQIEESAELNRRVAYQGPSDEIGRLARTFDEMIGRLEQAFESQKQFVADASHELRTPLTVIQGNLDLLKRNLEEVDRKESLRAIEAESKRLNRIASDLLLLAELEAGEKVKKDLVSLKRVTLKELERVQLLAGGRQITSGQLQDLFVRGDEHKLSLALSNLVENAIKYTPEGGVITISLGLEGEWARLEVSDNGIGIAAENLPHLFDRFYRVDKARSGSGRGTGLGLSIVREIIEKHGGKVTVASQVGKGSVFTVWLKL